MHAVFFVVLPPVSGETNVTKFGVVFEHKLLYSGCQKNESSPIFLKKLVIRLYPEFLST